MAEFKTKVKIGDAEHEVVIPGVVPEADVARDYMRKDAFEAEMNRRVTSATRDHFRLDDVATNEELKTKVAAKLGVDLKNLGKPPAEMAEAVNQAREQTRRELHAAEIEPREKKLGAASKRIQRLLTKDLHGQIMAAAAKHGVKRPLLTPGASGVPRIIGLVEGDFAFDEETEDFYVRDGQGFRVAPQPSAKRMYMIADEYFAAMAADPSNKDLFDSQAQGGPGGGEGRQSAGTASGKDIFLTPEQAEDNATYEKAWEQARKQGGVVKVKQQTSPYV